MNGSWLDGITKPLALASSAAGVVTVVIGLSLSTLNTALYWCLAAYLVGFTALELVGVVTSLRLGERRLALQFLGIWVVTGGFLVFLLLAERRHISSFGGAQVTAGALIVGALVATPLILRQLWKSAHKPCPECANFCKREARVCHFCGYRWLPALARPAAGAGD